MVCSVSASAVFHTIRAHTLLQVETDGLGPFQQLHDEPTIKQQLRIAYAFKTDTTAAALLPLGAGIALSVFVVKFALQTQRQSPIPAQGSPTGLCGHAAITCHISLISNFCFKLISSRLKYNFKLTVF